MFSEKPNRTINGIARIDRIKIKEEENKRGKIGNRESVFVNNQTEGKLCLVAEKINEKGETKNYSKENLQRFKNLLLFLKLCFLRKLMKAKKKFQELTSLR